MVLDAVGPPKGWEDGSDRLMGVIAVVGVVADEGGEGIDSGASAARTRARGLGKRTAMSGASGRERR
jgi:hypothetical protein